MLFQIKKMDSYLPLMIFEISAHLLPRALCAVMNYISSKSVHYFLFIEGSKWLCHLPIHYFSNFLPFPTELCCPMVCIKFLVQ